MVINHNMSSINANRQIGVNSANASKSMEKLSSGLRINRAGDDAAGLAISEKMRGQIRGLDQASANSQDAISMIQTAEGALSETHSILQRMRELSVQSATDTNTADDRSKIQSEVDQLAKEITRISNTTEFNTQNLLAGGLSDTFQIGANKGQNIGLSITKMDAAALGVANDLTQYGFATQTTGVSGLENASKDLTGYTIATTAKVDAAATTITKTAGAVGDLTITDAKTFNGSSDQAFTIRIDTVDATAGNVGRILSASISTDGGKTYSNLAVNSTGTDTTANVAGMALTFTTDVSNAASGTFSWTSNAEYKKVELRDDAGTPAIVGAATKVYNNMEKATIGAGDSTVEVSFKYADLADDAQEDKITSTITKSASATLDVNGKISKEAVTYAGIDVSSQKKADAAIKTIDNAIKTVSEERSKLGAYQNRLEHTIANLGTSSENLTSAESRIRDVNMAKEMSTFSKNNILSQAAQAMLAQANQQPQQVLQLLR